MNRNTFKQRTTSCALASRSDGGLFHVFLEGGRKAVARLMPKRTVLLRAHNIAEIGLAQTSGRLDQCG